MFSAETLTIKSFSGSMSGDDAIYSATETTALEVTGSAEDVRYKRLFGKEGEEPVADYKFYFSKFDQSEITSALLRSKGTLTFLGESIPVEVVGIDLLNFSAILKNIGGAV